MDTLDYFLESDSSKGISLKEICDHLGFKKSAAAMANTVIKVIS